MSVDECEESEIYILTNKFISKISDNNCVFK